MRWTLASLLSPLLSMGLGGCMVGPDYHRAPAPQPVVYKEQIGWTTAEPRAEINKGAWWSVFNDPLLDSLERQVNVSNQTIKEDEAAYREAVAVVHEAQASLFPTVTGTPSVTRQSLNSQYQAGGLGASSAGKALTQYSLEGSASWDIDVWGRIRREIESEQAAAQVSAADLANAQLSEQGTLATDYFELRYEDSLTKLLRDTATAYRRALQITLNQYNAGTASRGDLVTADAQLKTVEAELVGVGVQRAEYEHAIAVLAGLVPAQLSIPPGWLARAVPVVPTGLPSTLLERRPDIAAAERTMAEQNAQIGVAVAAYYPAVSLSGVFGFAGDPISQLFTVANRVWSLGASASETLIDGGLIGATVAAQRAGYEEDVATYRQTVLSAFQQIEDELASLRILEQQDVAEAAAVQAAQKAVDVTINEYRAGTVAYTSVITEEETLLTNQQAALSVQESRLVAAVALIQALGGGWQEGDLPGKVPIRLKNVLQP